MQVPVGCWTLNASASLMLDFKVDASRMLDFKCRCQSAVGLLKLMSVKCWTLNVGKIV